MFVSEAQAGFSLLLPASQLLPPSQLVLQSADWLVQSADWCKGECQETDATLVLRCVVVNRPVATTAGKDAQQQSTAGATSGLQGSSIKQEGGGASLSAILIIIKACHAALSTPSGHIARLGAELRREWQHGAG